MLSVLTVQDVRQHNSRSSCWVIIAGQVYDVTEFMDQHPGGSGIILRYAGKDATAEYQPLHPDGILETMLTKDQHLGPVKTEEDAVKDNLLQDEPISQSSTERSVIENAEEMPAGLSGAPRILPLSACQSLWDLRKVAEQKMTPKAKVYYESAVETFTSHDANALQWSKIRFRPRVLLNVAKANMKCTIMGVQSSMPVFIAPAAMARLGHSDGELCLARGAVRMAIPQCSATYSSVSHEQIMDCWNNDPHRRGSAPLFQLYVPRQKRDAEKLIVRARDLGFQALVITVDSPVIGKRDDDDRFKALLDYDAGIEPESKLPALPGEEAETLRGLHCSDFEWSDLSWVRELWGDRPIILKGIQSAEDAFQALKHDVQGIYLSNHGGRQLDHAPSSVETLLEIRMKYPEVLRKVEVYLDGGVWRGADVVKALCLGVKAVGLGRGFMFALSAFGTEGVLRAIQILSDEIQTTMRLLGATELSQLQENFVNTTMLTRDIFSARL